MPWYAQVDGGFDVSDTLFKQVNYTLGGLAQFIELGQVGVPDIQRPFVWKNAKVRDLFDSMYRGYPVRIRRNRRWNSILRAFGK